MTDERNEMYDENEDIIVLIGENGEEEKFEYVETIEMSGNEYVVLIPYDESKSDDSDDSEEVVILKIEHGENGEDQFITIEDEDELNDVFEEFKRIMEEEYELEEE